MQPLRSKPQLTLLRACVCSVASIWGCSAWGAETAAYQLPAFDPKDYQCSWLSSLAMKREPTGNGEQFDVALFDRGGAEIKGDPAGLIGFSPGSTITFFGTITVLPCADAGGPAPLVIAGQGLRFKLDDHGRLNHVSGSGTVTQGAKKTLLRPDAAKANNKAVK